MPMTLKVPVMKPDQHVSREVGYTVLVPEDLDPIYGALDNNNKAIADLITILTARSSASEPVYKRLEILEQAMARMKRPTPEPAAPGMRLSQDMPSSLEQAENSARGRRETAEQAQRNCEYYRGLVVQIGELFGSQAKIQDDGGIMEDVLCAKVPGLVAKLLESTSKIAEDAAHYRCLKRLLVDYKRLGIHLYEDGMVMLANASCRGLMGNPRIGRGQGLTAALDDTGQ